MNVEREISEAVKRVTKHAYIQSLIAIESTAGLREHHVRAMAQRFRKLERDIFGALRAIRRDA